jgi:hypothetical protein
VHGPEPKPLAPLVIVPLAAALLLALFAWPQARFEPRSLPVGVAGPPAAGEPLAEELARGGNAIEVHPYADAAEAREAIEDREVYGAFVAAPSGLTLLTASAGSPAVAALLQEAALASRAAAGEGGPPPPTVDVVPADPDDPRGGAFSASVLPLLIVGILTGILCATLVPAGLRQVGALVAASALAGLAAVAMTQGWLEVIEGSWVANAAVLGLMVLSVSSLVAGLIGLLGAPGIGVAAVLVVLIGNPWSGVATAPELLPTPTGDIGQLLPPGAAGNALRSTAFFDGAGVGGHLLVLLVWVGAGLGAVGAAAHRGRRVESAH